MDVEKLLRDNKDIDQTAKLEMADNFEREKISEMQKRVAEAINIIYTTNLFDQEYLTQIILTAQGNNGKKYRFTKNNVVEVDKDDYKDDDFVQGRRRDFVEIAPREDFEIHMKKALKEKRIFEVDFFDDVITYEEFIAHEIAHNQFDLKYFDKFGEYEEVDGKTDVANEYRKKLKDIIIPLVKEYYQYVEMEKFTFKRQQIAEIYAFLYQREFCKRSGINNDMHNKLDIKSQEFFRDPQKMLETFNKENNHDFSIEGHVYNESHVLSLAVARLIEEKYPNWEDRMAIFQF
ncbi:MAG: hypothetical protein WC819_05505 [Parcubacteria group bacterium]|jgi:hypothetical protein